MLLGFIQNRTSGFCRVCPLTDCHSDSDQGRWCEQWCHQMEHSDAPSGPKVLQMESLPQKMPRLSFFEMKQQRMIWSVLLLFKLISVQKDSLHTSTFTRAEEKSGSNLKRISAEKWECNKRGEEQLWNNGLPAVRPKRCNGRVQQLIYERFSP